MKRNNSGSLLNYFKVGSHTTLAEVQKQSVAMDNSSAINNDTTATSNECNVQLNDGNNIVPKYDISLYVNKKMSYHEKINVIKNMWVPNNSYAFKTQQIGSQNIKFNRFWLI